MSSSLPTVKSLNEKTADITFPFTLTVVGHLNNSRIKLHSCPKNICMPVLVICIIMIHVLDACIMIRVMFKLIESIDIRA